MAPSSPVAHESTRPCRFPRDGIGAGAADRCGSCIACCHTGGMARAISVRLDDEAERALAVLEASGMTRSEAIRSSLLASADRLRRRQTLAAEVAVLEADEADRAEMLAVASFMESMRAAG